jgi:uncharacterized protein
VKWRELFRLVHRDVGSFSVALTLAYALSGLAVNHLDDWNPNYRFETHRFDLGALPRESLAALEARVVAALALAPGKVRGHVQDSDTAFRVFLVGGEEVSVDLSTGRGEHRTLSRRPVFFQVNALHLNNLKGLWTYVADAFAVALMILAITGMTMMKGEQGFRGRGKWFVGAGLLVPVAFVVYSLS